MIEKQRSLVRIKSCACKNKTYLLLRTYSPSDCPQPEKSKEQTEHCECAATAIILVLTTSTRLPLQFKPISRHSSFINAIKIPIRMEINNAKVSIWRRSSSIAPQGCLEVISSVILHFKILSDFRTFQKKKMRSLPNYAWQYLLYSTPRQRRRLGPRSVATYFARGGLTMAYVKINGSYWEEDRKGRPTDRH